MTSNELQEMGLVAKGDQVKLRAFCNGRDRERAEAGKIEREAKLRKRLFNKGEAVECRQRQIRRKRRHQRRKNLQNLI